MPKHSPIIIDITQAPGLVNSGHPRYFSMEQRREMLRTLMDGTFNIRLEGEQFLIKHESENIDDYQLRLRTAVLTPFFSTAMNSMLSKPFEKPLTFDSELTHEKIIILSDNIDLEETHIHDFGYNFGLDATVSGISFILTDFQTNNVEDATAAEQESKDLRPYLSHIKAQNVFGWRTETVNARPVLKQFKYWLLKEVNDGEFGTKVIPVIRVLEPGIWREFRKDTTNKWTETAGGDVKGHNGENLTIIPVVPYYTKKTGFFTALPPHEDIGFSNIKYYQSRSDQDTSLHFARMPIYLGKGLKSQVPGQQQEDTLVIGANRIIHGDDNAELIVVEHTGSAIEAGRQDLKDLAEDIAAMTISAQFATPGNVTATAKAIDESSKNTVVKARTRNLENALNLAFDHMALFDAELDAFKEKNNHVASVNLNTDFGLTLGQEQDIQNLIRMRQMGEISSHRFLTEVQRRGLVSDDMNVEDELERADADAPEVEKTVQLDIE